MECSDLCEIMTKSDMMIKLVEGHSLPSSTIRNKIVNLFLMKLERGHCNTKGVPYLNML